MTPSLFFRLNASFRKQKNHIFHLSMGGTIISDEAGMAEAAFHHFTGLLGTEGSRAFTIALQAMDSRVFDLAGLERPFDEAEIWDAIKRLPTRKAPGPDGFMAEFLAACWDIIKADFYEAFQKFFDMNGRSFQGLNQALITLLSKKLEVASLSDFRPISLIHHFAKLVAKVLSLRLAPRLAELVSTYQSAFISGWCVHDNFFLWQQTARQLHSLRVPRVLLKLDITKAFDSVSWAFLLKVLHHLGFGNRWCEWISILLSTASMCVLLNDTPWPPISHRKGLRQGDPLFPMLFVIMIDVLNSKIQQAVSSGILHTSTK